MKHASKDYDRIQDPICKIPDDEPVFLLRSTDIFAPELLLRWANKVRLHGGDPKTARSVEDHAQAMINWQKTHVAKIPDSPSTYANLDSEHSLCEYCIFKDNILDCKGTDIKIYKDNINHVRRCTGFTTDIKYLPTYIIKV